MTNTFLIGLLLSGLFTAQVDADEPPNIVLILSDDQSWTDYGFMVHGAIQTPNLWHAPFLPHSPHNPPERILKKYQGEPQLFDLKMDLAEKANLAAREPALVKELSELLTAWYPLKERKQGVAASIPKAVGGAARKKRAKADEATRSPNDDSDAVSNASKRPNILFLLADDQRNHTLGCASHPIVKTPNIDRLASNGVRFENAFVTTSTCWVSRACLFTGCYERKHLYRINPGPLNPELCKTSYLTVLKNAGYRTGHIGKEHVQLDDNASKAMFDVRRQLGRKPYFKKQPDGTLRHETQILGDWGIEFINEQPKDQPFCLTISFNASHAEDGDKRPGIGHYPWPSETDGMYEDQQMPLPPLDDPEIYESQPDFLKKSINRQRFFWRWDTPEKHQTNMRAFFRMISGIDFVLGRLVEQLEKQGLAENTVIIYSADNGYYLGDRGFAGKWTHYEQSLRVPLVIYDPRLPNEKRGRVLSEMALNSDLASTMIQLAGETTPDVHTGHSLVPLIQGETPSTWRTDFLCEFLAVPGTIPKWEGVRDTDWVYARYYVEGLDGEPYEFLHDLQADPNQLVNIAMLTQAEQTDAHQTALIAMRQRCDELVAQNGPTMSDVLVQPKANRKKRANKSAQSN